jgi:hypothetical protein
VEFREEFIFPARHATFLRSYKRWKFEPETEFQSASGFPFDGCLGPDCIFR